MDEVWALSYEEEPNYNKLQFILTNILLNQNKVPQGNIEDWDDQLFDNFADIKVSNEYHKSEKNHRKQMISIS